LHTPALSAQDQLKLDTVRKKLLAIAVERCAMCHEEWFDLNVNIHGVCARCRKSSKYKPANAMFPGVYPNHLPELTQMEEMLIAPVHALVQVWQVRGGQYKYTGHICNFPRETAVFHAKVPLLPEQ
ncbi:hypothetical protein K435DRAFT_630076, partial [Dendrothele bispora CBS 962.96]